MVNLWWIDGEMRFFDGEFSELRILHFLGVYFLGAAHGGTIAAELKPRSQNR
jgi:hypothetical protein